MSSDVRAITLTGHGIDRGRTHGEELRAEIAEAIDAWFEHLGGRVDPAAFVDVIAHESGLLDPALEHTPDLVDEVRGIAEGSGQRFETMFAWQLIDECWWFLEDREASTADDATTTHEACSALAINTDGHGFVAQTQDLNRHLDRTGVFLRYLDPDGLEILAPSAPGLLAYNGVNSAGLAVVITSVNELPHQTTGASTGFVMPELLRCRSIDEALEWLQVTPLASGNSWTLGTTARSVVVAGSAHGVTVIADGDRALHTNHLLVDNLPRLDGTVLFDHTHERFAQLDATVQPSSTLDDLLAMYSTPPVCRARATDADQMSVGTMIFELGDTQRCHFAAGPLDTDPITTHEMSTRP